LGSENLAHAFDAIGSFLSGKNGHDFRYSDAALTPCGIYQALNLCYQISQSPKCYAVMESIKRKSGFTCKIKESINQLNFGGTELAQHIIQGVNGFTLNEAFEIHDVPRMFLGVSPLVRAIDTLFFATYFAEHVNVMGRVEILSMIQEVGSGWDGTIREERLPPGYKALTESFRAQKKVDEKAAEEARRSLADKVAITLKNTQEFQREIMDGLKNTPLTRAHTAFYEALVVTHKAQLLDFQHAISEEDRPNLQGKMRTALFGLMDASEHTEFLLGGHSMYFGHLLDAEGDANCKAHGKLLPSNGALWRAEYKKGAQPKLSKCEVIYGGFRDKVDDDNEAIREKYPGRSFESLEVLDSLEEDLADLSA
jgi:hypothetical protein